MVTCGLALPVCGGGNTHILSQQLGGGKNRSDQVPANNSHEYDSGTVDYRAGMLGGRKGGSLNPLGERSG